MLQLRSNLRVQFRVRHRYFKIINLFLMINATLLFFIVSFSLLEIKLSSCTGSHRAPSSNSLSDYSCLRCKRVILLKLRVRHQSKALGRILHFLIIVPIHHVIDCECPTFFHLIKDWSCDFVGDMILTFLIKASRSTSATVVSIVLTERVLLNTHIFIIMVMKLFPIWAICRCILSLLLVAWDCFSSPSDSLLP